MALETRTFPGTDVEVSAVGVGCNNFGMRIDEEETRAVVEATFDHGVNFFDTAASYGQGTSEELLGRAVGPRRGDVVIASKFPQQRGEGSCTPNQIRADCEASLSRLGTDYIDLYQQHYPDPGTPIADILGTLAELRDEGKIRAIGHSNFTPAMHDDAETAAATTSVRMCSSQVEWSLLSRGIEAEIVPAVERNGLGVLPYFPLASGLLTGKHERSAVAAGSRLDDGIDYFKTVLTDENWDRVEAISAWGAENGYTILELAFQWLLAQPSVVSVIAGATSPAQIASNAAAGAAQALDAAAAEAIGLL